MQRRTFLAQFSGFLAILSSSSGPIARATESRIHEKSREMEMAGAMVGCRFFKLGFSVPSPQEYKDFIQKNNKFKTNGLGIKRIELSTKLKHYIQLTNSHINEMLEYKADDAFNSWDIAVQNGDCEDIAIRKLDEFIDNGLLKRENLSIAICRAENKIGHAVLVLHSTEADYVIDSRFSHIPVWNRLPYDWLTIENHKNSDFFIMILPYKNCYSEKRIVG